MKHRDIWTKISFYLAYKVADTSSCSREILTKQLIMMCVGMYIKRDHVISILVTLKNPSILRYHGKLKAKKYGWNSSKPLQLSIFPIFSMYLNWSRMTKEEKPVTFRVMFIGTQVDTVSCKGADSVCCPLSCVFSSVSIMREAGEIPRLRAAQCAAAPRPVP